MVVALERRRLRRRIGDCHLIEPGTVTSASPLLVKLDSSATAVPALRLSSYTPVVADRVAVVRMGTRLLTLGKVL